MPLARLTLDNFRCFQHVDAAFSAGCNLVYGDNASGKTSLLEAVFFLSRGKSFRTSKLPTLVRAGEKGFETVARIEYSQGSQLPLGKRYDGVTIETRLSGATPSTLAAVSAVFPVLLFDAGAHKLIDGGPAARRRFLDWGVFHVEPAFLSCWRDYRRILRQRNALLRSSPGNKALSGWDKALAEHGVMLDGLRRQYVDNFSGLLPTLSAPIFEDQMVEVEYKAGWDTERALIEVLKDSHVRDLQMGSTQAGPHRAELLIKLGGRPAQQWISRGQQKVLAGILILAQAQLYRVLTGNVCTFLLDDLAAELDSRFLSLFLEQLWRTGAQSIITAIDPSLLAEKIPTGTTMFHVEHGRVEGAAP